jgi:ATP-dependent Clp protease ATP-binding subunit ClpX
VKRAGSDEALRCSFCHKSQDVVGKLISSPSDYPRAYICDECIAVCNSILDDDKIDQPSVMPHKIPKPLEVKEHLDQYVIGQEATKKKLAVAVYNHHCKRIHMNRMLNVQGTEGKVNYKGKVDGDTIKFTVEIPAYNQSIEMTAKRVP